MVWTEKRLIREDFEAWANGPVCPELYYVHQGKFMICESDIVKKCFGLSDLNDDERDSVDIVLNTYGSFDPYELREMTHRELPWKEARGDIPGDAKCQNVISLDRMASFYSEL